MGERINRLVALVTDDFRRYHDLVPFFEAEGVVVLGLSPREAVPASVRAIIGGPPDDPRTVPMLEDREALWLAVMAALDPRRIDGAYRRVVVGVDPGDTMGLAVLADGALFWVRECRSVEEVGARLAAWHPALEAQRWEVHVGDGAPTVGTPLVTLLRERFPGMHVSLVPEGASTPVAPVTLSRHTDAAVQIAMREPV